MFGQKKVTTFACCYFFPFPAINRRQNDANDWAREHHKPRYTLDLLLSVINVSVQTVDIVNHLPKLKFD